MNVEYTGRQFVITPAVRKQVETGLTKLTKLLGNNFETHVILIAEKRLHKAEITIHVRDNPLVGAAEATDMTSAIGEALDHIDRQALKYKSRWKTKRRQAAKKKSVSADAQTEQVRMAVGASATAAVPVVVHGFPNAVRMTEAHLVKSDDSVALKPMTLEEAIKECEFRDRDVFVFRDPEGRVKVLHRTKDGKLELIEAP
jgi:putative sigma-54 modulation protein